MFRLPKKYLQDVILLYKLRLPKKYLQDVILLNKLCEDIFHDPDPENLAEEVAYYEDKGGDLEADSVSLKILVILYNRVYNFSFYSYFKLILTENELKSENFVQFKKRLSMRSHEFMLTFDSKNCKDIPGFYDLNRIWEGLRITAPNYSLVNTLIQLQRTIRSSNEEFSSCKDLTGKDLLLKLDNLRMPYVFYLEALVQYVFLRQELFQSFKKLNQCHEVVFGMLDLIFTLDKATCDFLFLLISFNEKYVYFSKSNLSNENEKKSE
jgi:hypothetical protein